ncbi:DUF3365 domain-containing protein [Geobacter anodireducens]|uniref:DUF3365 domain-containing protein n=1 Tax=Geobacter anodireducens TaxID=1340425 RepID=A0ABR9NY94_9BACT|nr:DUF3365 domain-containing protein [Geobacter anodireducens]MBE2889241.1 DUF3365 domain-containing protein [Geobacter anodireducens]
MKRMLATCLFATLVGTLPAFGAEGDAVARARMAADRLSATLRERVMTVMKEKGPAEAVKVCFAEAQKLTAELARTEHLSIRRTSLRIRNPANSPDPFERSALERLAAMKEQGSLPGEMIVPARVGGKQILRYVKPILVQPGCLVCHGAEDSIPPEVKTHLQARYPGDRATGFAAGDLRGIVSVVVDE